MQARAGPQAGSRPAAPGLVPDARVVTFRDLGQPVPDPWGRVIPDPNSHSIPQLLERCFRAPAPCRESFKGSRGSILHHFNGAPLKR